MTSKVDEETIEQDNVVYIGKQHFCNECNLPKKRIGDYEHAVLVKLDYADEIYIQAFERHMPVVERLVRLFKVVGLIEKSRVQVDVELKHHTDPTKKKFRDKATRVRLEKIPAIRSLRL